VILPAAAAHRWERFASDRYRRQYFFAHGLFRLALSNIARSLRFPTGASKPIGVATFSWPALLSVTNIYSASSERKDAWFPDHQAVGINIEDVQLRDLQISVTERVFSKENRKPAPASAGRVC
jgi:hypothetical protein